MVGQSRGALEGTEGLKASDQCMGKAHLNVGPLHQSMMENQQQLPLSMDLNCALDGQGSFKPRTHLGTHWPQMSQEPSNKKQPMSSNHKSATEQIRRCRKELFVSRIGQLINTVAELTTRPSNTHSQ